MVIDSTFLDDLTAQAKGSNRLRQSYDLRTTPNDSSQRILNAIEPGTVMAIHRHLNSTETVTCIRGCFRELFYNNEGALMSDVIVKPGIVVNVPIGQWHNLESLESGTVLLSCKDGAYAPLKPEEIWENK